MTPSHFRNPRGKYAPGPRPESTLAALEGNDGSEEGAVTTRSRRASSSVHGIAASNAYRLTTCSRCWRNTMNIIRNAVMLGKTTSAHFLKGIPRPLGDECFRVRTHPHFASASSPASCFTLSSCASDLLLIQAVRLSEPSVRVPARAACLHHGLPEPAPRPVCRRRALSPPPSANASRTRSARCTRTAEGVNASWITDSWTG